MCVCICVIVFIQPLAVNLQCHVVIVRAVVVSVHVYRHIDGSEELHMHAAYYYLLGRSLVIGT